MDMSNDGNDGPREDQPGTDIRRRTVTISNRRGLHARAAAKFVKLAAQFDATVTVIKDGTSVCGTSIMGLMMLAATTDQDIAIEAAGPQSVEALASLADLVAGNFGEE